MNSNVYAFPGFKSKTKFIYRIFILITQCHPEELSGKICKERFKVKPKP